ncbi:uncharacterized protein BX664DRAFT_299035 [Halteromyces radiatus]|uniref:uncharacterized protein n=1 Tax=Halteromyces radiatus TaxID=101107 RepID=UPI0022203137|nr:uncharacterized protein BX664DRAFT_299035 [Halteromyces radiatus]KAI8086400.1 hypothetical protein BX664DRAFT_299035 [Halteromyces radiatus]
MLVLLLLLLLSFFSFDIDGIQERDATIQAIPDFRSPKRIGFSAVGGGSSHFYWVLEILQKLEDQGHDTFLFTRGACLNYAKDYPKVETQVVGGDLNMLEAGDTPKPFKNHLQHNKPNPHRFITGLMPVLLRNYSNEFLEYEQVIKHQKLDLMICDMFAFACMDATVKANIPLVISSTLAYTSDARTSYVTNEIPSFYKPTTETASIYERLRYLFYKYYLVYKMKRLGLPAHQFQKQHGIPLTVNLHDGNVRGAFKLVNNMFGLEAARPLGPLVNMMGPIMKHKYDALTPELDQFLNTHQRVAYVAFGQHAKPTNDDTIYLLESLIYCLENDLLDGVIWATSDRHPLPSVPSQYHPMILVTGWAPQFAILQHPSTRLFVTHGGAASVHEALFSKVPLFVFPFFGDQPLTARMVQQLHLGDTIDTAGIQYTTHVRKELTHRMQHVLTDPSIQHTVRHFGNALQVQSLHSVQRGADLIEEVLFSAINGQLLHRQDVGYRIHWFKRYNTDLVLILMTILGVVTWIVCKLMIRSLNSSYKVKTL